MAEGGVDSDTSNGDPPSIPFKPGIVWFKNSNVLGELESGADKLRGVGGVPEVEGGVGMLVEPVLDVSLNVLAALGSLDLISSSVEGDVTSDGDMAGGDLFWGIWSAGSCGCTGQSM